jgi:hypothetical protein
MSIDTGLPLLSLYDPLNSGPGDDLELEDSDSSSSATVDVWRDKLFVCVEPPRDNDMGEVPVECLRDFRRSAVIDSVSDFRFLRVLRTVSSNCFSGVPFSSPSSWCKTAS